MGLSLGISFLRAILLGLGVIGLSGGVAKRSSLTGWKEGVSVRLTALVCLGLSLPTGEPVLGEPVEKKKQIKCKFKHILLRGILPTIILLLNIDVHIFISNNILLFKQMNGIRQQAKNYGSSLPIYIHIDIKSII